MNKYAYILSPVFLLCLLLSLGSCVKQLDTEINTAVQEKNMWQSFDDARAGLASMYGLTRAALAQNNAHWMYGELRFGDFQPTQKGGYLDAVINNQLNKNFTQVKSLTNWRPFYAAIDACNTFIEKSPNCLKDVRYSDLNNRVDIAQAHILRAFIYFYMVRIWGDVPLITTSVDSSINLQIARTPQSTVMNYSINELNLYKDSLPTEYGGGDRSALLFKDRYYGGTWNTWGNSFWGYYQCYALLANMYAWVGDYTKCMAAIDRVITTTSGGSSAMIGVKDPHGAIVTFDQVKAGYLTGDANSIFYDKGIKGDKCYQLVSFPFYMDASESGPSGIGHIESLTLANPYVPRIIPEIYMPRDTIDKLFYTDYDLRHPFSIANQNYGEVYFSNYFGSIPVFIKFRNIAPGSTSFPLFGSCIPIMRIEDLVLLRAEAAYARGDFRTGYREMNVVRKQRNTPGYYDTGTTPDGVNIPFTIKSVENGILWNIFRERRVELAGEGTRWYDMIRYAKLDPSSNPVISALIANGGIYWPIDEDIIRKNPLIEQNAYWKK